MSYKINNIEQQASTGFIMGYFGTIDPPGWVIADGQARTNTNNIYTPLANLTIGTLLNGNYTPPNLKAAFLRGTGTNSGYTGPPLKTIYTPEMYSHNHTASQPAHTHVLNAVIGTTSQYALQSGTTRITAGTAAAPAIGAAVKNGYSTVTGVDANGTELKLNSTYGITINYADINITMNPTIVGGLSDNNESRPYNIGTAWIIKI